MTLNDGTPAVLAFCLHAIRNASQGLGTAEALKLKQAHDLISGALGSSLEELSSWYWLPKDGK